MPWVVPIVHPAAIVRGRWADADPQVTYLSRVHAYLNGSFVPPPDPQEPPPNSLLNPTLSTLAAFDTHLTRGEWDGVSIDLENAGQFITLVGLTLFSVARHELGPSLSLPFRVRNGYRYWGSRFDHDRAVEYLGSWLASPLAKLFHNGIVHDVPLLEQHGFEVAGELYDSMVMAHYCYPELRKALQYNCTLYLGSPVWKTLVDEDDEAEGKG